eukprot:m.173770 g.173770  ORF g.173770 m.173770 type:complete len:126 (-) comp18309_c0_seq7:93-470(-)
MRRCNARGERIESYLMVLQRTAGRWRRLRRDERVDRRTQRRNIVLQLPMLPSHSPTARTKRMRAHTAADVHPCTQTILPKSEAIGHARTHQWSQPFRNAFSDIVSTAVLQKTVHYQDKGSYDSFD